MFRSEANHLHFSGPTGDDSLPVVAALHNLIHKQGYKDIVLDFSKVGFLNPRFMLPVVATARLYRLEKVDFDIIEPEDEQSARMMVNSNWAHLILPEKFDPRDDQNRKHLSAIRYANAADQFNAVDRSINVILETTGRLDRSRLKALEWSLNEITDNVLNHADSPIGGFMQVMTFPKKQLVEFYVCDGGVGIPKTLRTARPKISDDVTALRQAIEEGVTRNPKTNQGNGLFGTFKCCEVSKGEFDIISGHALLKYRPGNLHASQNKIPLKGTFVRASINYGFEQLLERALIFKGRAHDPGGDYVERIYQNSTEDIYFKVDGELSNFGSRESGKLARNKIENLMNMGRETIIFDFEGIQLISSSFADEVFGKLFVSLGPIKFGQVCRFQNVESTVQKLIDRAISQRMLSP